MSDEYPQPKTIDDAVKLVPPQYREKIKTLWELAGCMDLYDGNLTQYLDVIISQWKFDKAWKRTLIRRREEMLKVLDWPSTEKEADQERSKI